MFQEHKTTTLNIVLIALVFLYAFVGGTFFMLFEDNNYLTVRAIDLNDAQICIKERLIGEYRNFEETLYNDCLAELLDLNDWTFINGIIYAFAIMTTVGFRDFSPETVVGQIFCIVFSLLGIPLSMIALANVGAYIKELTCKGIQWYKKRRGEREGMEDEDELVEMTGTGVLFCFLSYVLLGAFWTFASESDYGFVASFYFTFASLTGGDIGYMASGKIYYISIRLLYAAIGLSIATVAIDVGSDYLKKIHYIGRKLSDSANTLIWFGGKKLTAKNLVQSVGQKCGITIDNIETLNFNELVESAIAVEQGEEIENECEPLVIEEDSIEDPSIIVQSSTISSDSTPTISEPQSDSPEPEPTLIIPEVIVHLAESDQSTTEEEEEEFIPPEPTPTPEVKPAIKIIIEPEPQLPPEEPIVKQLEEPQSEKLKKKSFVESHKSAVSKVVKAEPGRPKTRHDPAKSYEVYRKEWGKVSRLVRLSNQMKNPTKPTEERKEE